MQLTFGLLDATFTQSLEICKFVFEKLKIDGSILTAEM
jgi:hypothetical protein